MNNLVVVYLNMKIEHLEHVATLMGEPARIKILWALMDGKAHTATELATVAAISAQSASMHLSKLVQADLLKVNSQGRHRYYSYARDEVAYAIEAMASLIPGSAVRVSEARKITPFRYCRSCYDHLAGEVGVTLTDSLMMRGYLQLIAGAFEVTESGLVFFSNFGIDMATLSKQKRPLTKPCLDWSERRPHLAGSIGAALLAKMISDHWIRRIEGTRTLCVTSVGKSNLYDQLGLTII